jgi:hypothetical protein
VRGAEVIVAFAHDDAFNRRMADSRAHRAAIEAALSDLAGAALRVTFELRDLGEVEAEAEPPSEEELVARFKAAFDAEEIVAEEPPDQEGKA